jgi:hypothetical protein
VGTIELVDEQAQAVGSQVLHVSSLRGRAQASAYPTCPWTRGVMASDCGGQSSWASLPLAPEADDVKAFDVVKPAFTLGFAMRSGTLRGRSLLGFRTSEKFMMAGKDGDRHGPALPGAS